MEKQKQPEDYYSVEITDKTLRISRPFQDDQVIDLDEIEEIRMVNTDRGPVEPDVWLVLSGNGKHCGIPQGSEGWTAVYDIVSKYPGFDFEQVIQSAACTENRVFDLWKK